MGIEMPLVRVLGSMEAHGLTLNPSVLTALKPNMLKRMKQLEDAAAAALGGQRVNLSRSAEVAKALYQTLHLAPPPGSELG